ncbi:MAG: HAMP domain-containing histidine kinase [Chloroflexi bacterium]|nr:HAMP domain-containing histidine kinase [Chloroflexota bacterium]MBK6712806.1 HAMP domain-containing histidine kinase [Chloroflexota bacterium]MBK8934941.1 HAMP domain-containing histidine kinase [Chloroflexota bacterium]MBP6804073.1 HAMP domain-containing histidine kinase [Chloroflexota bacterium]
MIDELKQWLPQQVNSLTSATLYRAPNLLPDVEDVIGFIHLLADNVGHAREVQLSSVQFWALTSIGYDARAANDWLIVLQVLKEEIGKGLEKRFTAVDALAAWRTLDDILTYALIEATQLASDIDHAELLEHTQQLRQQMEDFERSKSNFIAVAAHELKTPLTLLEGYANILRVETEPDSRLRLYVDGLNNGFRRMYEIINDMIDVSLIDLQSVELNYTQFYLERIILMVADSLDKHYHARQIDLIIMPLGQELRIFADQEKLTNAFNKVLFNALKFTPDGGKVTVSSTLTRQAEADEHIAGYVDVQIQDTGIGINPEALEMIFDKFTSTMDASLHSSSKTKFKGGGPGLGLPIARGIVEAHGGRIWAESSGCNEETMPGSTFHIELPIWLHKPTVR